MIVVAASGFQPDGTIGAPGTIRGPLASSFINPEHFDCEYIFVQADKITQHLS